MTKKSEKAAVDTKQVPRSEGSENKNPPADVQQEVPAEEIPDVQQAQQPSPDLRMKMSEIMHPPEEAQEGTGGSVDAGAKQSPSDLKDGQREEQTGQSGKQHAVTYRITCRNKISKVIGGVSFVNGVGYTNDGFTASWFGNKDGYEVKESGS